MPEQLTPSTVADDSTAVTDLPKRIAEKAAAERAEVLDLTEAGQAHSFALANNQKLRWCPQRKTWLEYRGHRWVPGPEAELVAKELAKELAITTPIDETNPEEKRWRKHNLTSRGIANTLDLAKSHPAIRVDADQIDALPYALNTPGGIVDLRTGQMRPSDPDELHTRSTAVTPDMDGGDPVEFLEFLTWAMQEHDDRDELITYLQTSLGLTCIGQTLQHVLLFCFGPGGTGKSTTIETAMDLLGNGEGGYAVAAAATLLTRSSRGGNTPEIAQLRGYRMVACTELDGEERFNEPLLKSLVSGDTMNATAKYENPHTFRPVCTVWLGSNKQPAVTEGGNAFWRRTKQVPFTNKMEDDNPNRRDNMREYLIEKEGAKILAWMIRGAIEYVKTGKLHTPATVLAATNDYRRQEDPLAAFVEDECVLGAVGVQGFTVAKTALIDRYGKWCEVNDVEEVTTDKVTKALKHAHGIVLDAGRRNYRGVRFKQEYERTAAENH